MTAEQVAALGPARAFRRRHGQAPRARHETRTHMRFTIRRPLARARPRRREPGLLWSVPVWCVVALCCALPLGWMAIQVVRIATAGSTGSLIPTGFQLRLLGRTLAYSLAAAALATLLAVPAALVLGRGRGLLAKSLWLLLPAALLLPSITYAYGWSQLVRLASGPLGRVLAAFFDQGSPALAWVGVVLRAPEGAPPEASLELAGRADVLRCVGTLAAWLWALPAGVLGLALGRVDTNLQQQALLDGALGRLTARQLAGPAAASMACVAVLAGQEFAVYEPTGISVVATEVRQVFETGAFATPGNPITAPFVSGGGAVSDGSDGERPTTASPSPGTPGEGRGEGLQRPEIRSPRSGERNAQSLTRPSPGLPGEGYALSATTPQPSWTTSSGPPDQDARAGAAVATSLPLLAIVAILGGLAAWGVGRVSAAEELDVGPWPRVLEAGRVTKCLAVVILVVTLVVPTAAMVASLQVHRDLGTIWAKFSPQAAGSLVIAACAAVVATGMAFLAAVRRPRGAMVLSLATFLIGGQLLAIALIRLYNRPAPWPLNLTQSGGGGAPGPAGGGGRPDAFDLIYNGIPIVVMAYLARFGWLALLAAGATRSRPWRQVRELADLDGATPAQAARHVVWPLAWPLLAASALLVGVLSLTEVPATVLISPLRPQPLVPMLMGWVHMLRYDDMIEGSLLLMAMAFALSLLAAGLIALGLRWAAAGAEGRGQKAEGRRQKAEGRGQKEAGRGGKDGGGGTNRASGFRFCLLPSALCLFLPGCSDPTQPEAIWLETGTGPGQVVYPRAISYSPGDDSFYVIDRLARIQHLDANGRALNEWRMPDWRVGKPVGLSVGPDGNVYVADTHYHRVVVYSPTGQELRKWGGHGTGPGQFIWPTDVAFDAAGDVYVSEYGDNDRVQVFAPDGTFRRAFGQFGTGDGQLMRPQSLVIDGDLVYVADACNHRIAVFRTDGTFVRNMGGGVGAGPGQFRFPYGLDVDGRGRLVVCEFGNNRVQLVDQQTGAGLGVWGTTGRAPGQLAYPWAVALDRAGRVVTVDSGNNRLQVFEF